MKITINPDRSVTAHDETGHDETGQATGRQWDMPLSQLEAHLRGVESKDHPFAKASQGELSAARDAANEFRKQLKS